MLPPGRVNHPTSASPGGTKTLPLPPLPTSASSRTVRRTSTVTYQHRGVGPNPGFSTTTITNTTTINPATTTTTTSNTTSNTTTISSASHSNSRAHSHSAVKPCSTTVRDPSAVSRAQGPDPAPPSPPLSPRDRLEGLINTITCVLRCYAPLPTRSPAFLDALHSFRERAIGMYRQVGPGSGNGTETGTESGTMTMTGTGTGTGTEAPPTAEVGPGVGNDVSSLSTSPQCAMISGEVDGPVSSQDPRGADTGLHMGTPTALDIRDAPETLVTPRESSAPPSPSPYSGLSEQVDALEKEWWESEVVAAWFGPRPGCFAGASRTRSGPRQGREREGAGASRRLDLRRDTSYVGLYDE